MWNRHRNPPPSQPPPPPPPPVAAPDLLLNHYDLLNLELDFSNTNNNTSSNQPPPSSTSTSTTSLMMTMADFLFDDSMNTTSVVAPISTASQTTTMTTTTTTSTEPQAAGLLSTGQQSSAGGDGGDGGGGVEGTAAAGGGGGGGVGEGTGWFEFAASDYDLLLGATGLGEEAEVGEEEGFNNHHHLPPPPPQQQQPDMTNNNSSSSKTGMNNDDDNYDEEEINGFDDDDNEGQQVIINATATTNNQTGIKSHHQRSAQKNKKNKQQTITSTRPRHTTTAITSTTTTTTTNNNNNNKTDDLALKKESAKTTTTTTTTTATDDAGFSDEDWGSFDSNDEFLNNDAVPPPTAAAPGDDDCELLGSDLDDDEVNQVVISSTSAMPPSSSAAAAASRRHRRQGVVGARAGRNARYRSGPGTAVAAAADDDDADDDGLSSSWGRSLMALKTKTKPLKKQMPSRDRKTKKKKKRNGTDDLGGDEEDSNDDDDDDDEDEDFDDIEDEEDFDDDDEEQEQETDAGGRKRKRAKGGDDGGSKRQRGRRIASGAGGSSRRRKRKDPSSALTSSIGPDFMHVGIKIDDYSVWPKQVAGFLTPILRIRNAILTSAEQLTRLLLPQSELTPILNKTTGLLYVFINQDEMGVLQTEISDVLAPLLRSEKFSVALSVFGKSFVTLSTMTTHAAAAVLAGYNQRGVEIKLEVFLNRTAVSDCIPQEIRRRVPSNEEIRLNIARILDQVRKNAPKLSRNKSRKRMAISEDLVEEEALFMDDLESLNSTKSLHSVMSMGEAMDDEDDDAWEDEEDSEFATRDLTAEAAGVGLAAADSENRTMDERSRLQIDAILAHNSSEIASGTERAVVADTNSLLFRLEEVEPPDSLVVQLRPYQKQALGWMTRREYSSPDSASSTQQQSRKRLRNGSDEDDDDDNDEYDDDDDEDEDEDNFFNENKRASKRLDTLRERPSRLHPLWRKRRFADTTLFYFNPFTGELKIERPPPPTEPHGGILADDMGLGKTIELLSLILAHTAPSSWLRQPLKQQPTDIPVPQDTTTSSLSSSSSSQLIKSHATLVVCPLTLVDQWADEIQSKSSPSLSVYKYYGQHRIRDVERLARTSGFDVIVTTYNTLLSDSTQQSVSPLFGVYWWRVVLDEAHTIKNRGSKLSKAAFALEGENRWCLTGTPIQNSLDDVFSLFKFLRLDPFGEFSVWNKIIVRPFEKDQDPRAVKILGELISTLLLRRTKSTHLGDLPKKNIDTLVLQLDQEERLIYDAIRTVSKAKFDLFVRAGTLMSNYAGVLELVLRMRQACGHPLLVFFSLAKSFAHSPGAENVEWAEFLLNCYFYRIRFPEAPPLPYDEISKSVCDPSVSQESVRTFIAMMNANYFSHGRRMTLSELDGLFTGPDAGRLWKGSTKINVLVTSILQSRQQDPTSKSVVFSQWTSMLDLVELAFQRSRIRFVRLDGSMSKRDRERSISKFRDDPDTMVMLISLKAGGVGLNLVWASHVFLLDPWWNPAVEDQAIDRVHRIGQQRTVTVWRFIIANSVEERILALQKKKSAIASDTLGMGRSDAKKMRVSDLQLLFE